MSLRRAPAAAAASLSAVMVLLVSACTTSQSSSTSTTVTSPAATTSPTTSSAPPTAGGAEGVPAISHLFVVVMENLGASGAMQSASLSQLAHRYQWTTGWYAVSHPSLPNYLAMASGSTSGVSSDCTDCIQHGPDLASQLSVAGISWGAYFEGMPSSCYLGPSSPDGSYALKHDPFVYFEDIRSNPAWCSHVQPLTAFNAVMAGPTAAVPRMLWVTPNLCHSGHDCSASVAGTWLDGFVAQVTATSAWKQGGAMVVVWDEGSDDAGMDPATGVVSRSGGGGEVLAIVIVPGSPAGRSLSGPYSHYSLLRTVEDAFGLPHLGHAGDPGVVPLSAFFGAGD